MNSAEPAKAFRLDFNVLIRILDEFIVRTAGHTAQKEMSFEKTFHCYVLLL